MIPCNECRQCNRKGRASVMKGSAYCDSHIKSIRQVNRSGIFSSFKNFLFERRYDEKTNKLKTKKGFRDSWFWK